MRSVLLVLALSAGAFHVPSARALEASCTDGLDDDADGVTDCDDKDCWLDAACVQSVTRTISVVRDVPADPSTRWLNIYLVSWPEIPDIPDIGNSNIGTRGCVGDAGGPAIGDGVINSLDAACVIWMSNPARPSCGLQFTRFDSSLCQFRPTGIVKTALGTSVTDTFFPIVPHEAYYLTISSSAPVAPSFTVTLRGWRDPAWRGDSVTAPTCRPSLRLLPIPYDTLSANVDEILCGLEGVDWFDANSDGDPDTCPNGLFDGTSPITIGTFDNDQGLGPTGTAASDDAWAMRTVLRTDLGLAFLGPQVAVAPGEAVLIQLTGTQLPRSWLDPRR